MGGPRTGKTTLALMARANGRLTVHTDDYMHLGWEESAEHIRFLLRDAPSFIVEGVRAEGAIRRGLQVDTLVWLRSPIAPRTKAQIRMGDKVDTRIQDAINSGVLSGAVIIVSGS